MYTNINMLQKSQLKNYLKQIDISGILKKYKTPFYLYDGNIIKQRYNELYHYINWPDLKIFYAMKANYNPAILKLLLEENAYLDTVSPAEVLLALKIGYPPENIIFTANNMTDDEMFSIQKMGILFTIGSLSRLKKFGKTFPGSKICLRFNTNVVAGEHKTIQTGGALTKFGILLKDVDKIKQIVNQYNLTVVGLHEHTGSGIAEEIKIYQSMKNLLSVATRENFPQLEFIDFGGGFKVPYHPAERRNNYETFGKKISDIFNNHCELYGKKLKMFFEPGKYIVSEAGFLIVQVNTIKNNQGRNIAGVNSGFPHLIRPLLYDAYHHIVNISNPDGKLQQYDVCGNICETGDCFSRDREINEIREGDYLMILNAGAYCYAMGSIYNLRALPQELILINNQVQLARKGLSAQELVEQILGECQ